MATMLSLGAGLVLFVLLGVAAVIDIRTRTVPNAIPVGIVLLWVIWRGVMALAGASTQPADDVVRALSSGAFGACLLAASMLYERLTGRFSLGGGDIKLLTAATLFVGVRLMMVVLFVACAVSMLYALADRWAPKSRGIPFAPCILCGVAAMILVV